MLGSANYQEIYTCHRQIRQIRRGRLAQPHPQPHRPARSAPRGLRHRQHRRGQTPRCAAGSPTVRVSKTGRIIPCIIAGFHWFHRAQRKIRPLVTTKYLVRVPSARLMGYPDQALPRLMNHSRTPLACREIYLEIYLCLEIIPTWKFIPVSGLVRARAGRRF